MITEKIKFSPEFVKQDAASYCFAEVETENLTPARIWRNLCNISVWNRFNPDVVDIQPLDPGDNDPHLFDKMQFNYDLASGQHVAAQVIFCQSPKDDRPGRLAYQGTVVADNKDVNEFIVEVIVGVPDHTSHVTVQAAMSAKNDITYADKNLYTDALQTFLYNLAKWSERHD